MMKQYEYPKPTWAPIIGVHVGPVFVVLDGQKVRVPDNYNPGPAKNARWDEPAEPSNRGKEIQR